MKYILGIGTNIGDRKSNIDNAIESINLTPYTDVLKRSALYETEPVGYARQQNFYNCVVLVESLLNPHEILGMCLGIESGFGRKRGIVNGPRILDIDFLLYEGENIKTENLIVPHPRIRERRFVIEPLKDLFPSGEVFGYDFCKNEEQIEGQDIKRIEDMIDYHIND